MRKFIITFVVGAVLGIAGGFAAGIFAYPYLFLNDIVASEQVPGTASESTAGRSVAATGSFIHANPKDPIHYGKGGVTVYQDLVHMEADFEVGPGPKYHVYLVPETNITPMTNVEKTMFVDLGRLKAFRGSQNYPVPAGVDLAKYSSVVIWCEQFGVLISPAALQFK